MEQSLKLLVSTSYWFGISLVLFSVLGAFFACNPNQPRWRKDFSTDMAYWFIGPLVYAQVQIFLIMVGLLLIFWGDQERMMAAVNGHGFFGNLPLWLQCVLVFVFTDFLQYWLHRLFHTGHWWKYHAIHHSSPHVDWLSAVRFHPINHIFSFTAVAALMIIMGFTPMVFVVTGPFNILYSGMVHANLNWTFGPFRYVLASPVFHRWHHTTQKEGLDKNFAPTFPILDVIFGTFYMPQGRLPEHYGILGEAPPQDFIGQLRYPFRPPVETSSAKIEA